MSASQSGSRGAGWTAGIDVGSTYTKAVLLSPDGERAGAGLRKTGYRLEEAAEGALDAALEQAGISRSRLSYLATTGHGRSRVSFRDVQATSLTAQAWGARRVFPATRTVLDVGGQTMKAIRIDGDTRVRSFRLNDKCAAGTGAFLEKAAGYLGYQLEEIGPLVETAREAVPISGVCAVFAESEVINHVSQGEDPADIMYGAMASLIEKSVRLMKRVRMEPEFTLVGGIMRFPAMTRLMREELEEDVNVPPEELVQFTGALGAAVLARRRWAAVREAESVPGAEAGGASDLPSEPGAGGTAAPRAS